MQNCPVPVTFCCAAADPMNNVAVTSAVKVNSALIFLPLFVRASQSLQRDIECSVPQTHFPRMSPRQLFTGSRIDPRRSRSSGTAKTRHFLCLPSEAYSGVSCLMFSVDSSLKRFKSVRNLKECPCDVFDLVLRVRPSFLGFPCVFLGPFSTHRNSTYFMLFMT